MTDQDFLWVWWMGHGGIDESCPDIYFLIENTGEYVYDHEFASYVNQITSYKWRSFSVMTCNSGGIIDDLESNKTVILTAVPCGEGTWSAEYDVWHAEFTYNLFCALDWETPSGSPINADDNSNGLVSMYEAWDYTYDNRTWRSDPQYNDLGFIGANMYIFCCGYLVRDTHLLDDIDFTGDVIVDNGVILTIDPGVMVTFAATSDDYDGGMGEYSSNLCELVVKGELVAHGNPENSPIYFQSSTNSDNTGEWYGIVFENTADDESELYGCVIKNAKYGIYDYGTNLNIEKNSIIYNQYTGIVCNSYASPTIYDNYIQFNGSWGIWCYNHSSPYIRHNRISDNDSWGLVCSVCSSPQLSGENSSNPYGANEVEDNGAGEVICYSSCYPCLGFGISEQSKGMNTIKAETGLYEVKSYSSNPIYAHFNYWGEDGANTSDNVETNCPRDDPYSGVGPTWASGGGSPLQRFPSVEVADLGSQPFRLNRSLSNGDIEEYVRRGLASEGDKDYEGAVVAYRYVVDYYPESEYAPFCLSRLMACRASERKDGLEAGWLRGKATTLSNSPVGKLASLVLPLSMAAGGNFQGAIEECERVARFYQKTDIQIVKEALFEMGHIYLFYMGDKQMAKQVFQELAKRFPGDELLEAAQELMGTFHSEGLRKKELDQKESTAPANCSLSQNYPNPGNPSTCITFILPQKAHVTLEIYNLLGQRVRTLVERVKDAGSHTVVWDGRDKSGNPLPSGVYLYRLRAGELVQTKKMLLLQ